MGTGNSAEARRTVWAALSLLSISGSVAISCGLLFAPRISQALLGSTEYAPLVRISLVGAAGIALQQTLMGLFAGRSDLRAPLTARSVARRATLAAISCRGSSAARWRNRHSRRSSAALLRANTGGFLCCNPP
jgi:hypothetical protein